MSPPRSVLGLMLFVTLVAMLVCGACGTARPTLSGQVVSPMYGGPKVGPVEGVIITVQEAKLLGSNDQSPRFGALQPDDVIETRPPIIASAVSDSEGKFSIPGALIPIMGYSNPFYRVRFHRDDFRDAVVDFYYPRKGSLVPFYLESKSLGPIPLRPYWAAPPWTQPAVPADVISK